MGDCACEYRAALVWGGVERADGVKRKKKAGARGQGQVGEGIWALFCWVKGSHWSSRSGAGGGSDLVSGTRRSPSNVAL